MAKDYANILNYLPEGKDLTFEQARNLLDTIFDRRGRRVQIAAFLAAMRVKKAAVSEIAGLASSLRRTCRPRRFRDRQPDRYLRHRRRGAEDLQHLDRLRLVAAGAGVYVAKHGNRAITSNCGSADVLTALGVNVAPGPERVAECIRKAHIGFMFAPKFHPAMKHVQPIRQNLDFRRPLISWARWPIPPARAHRSWVFRTRP